MPPSIASWAKHDGACFRMRVGGWMCWRVDGWDDGGSWRGVTMVPNGGAPEFSTHLSVDEDGFRALFEDEPVSSECRNAEPQPKCPLCSGAGAIQNVRVNEVTSAVLDAVADRYATQAMGDYHPECYGAADVLRDLAEKFRRAEASR